MQTWGDPVTFVVAVAGILSVGCLVAGAAYIFRTEWNVIYLDPPDAQEMRRMEDAIRERCATDDEEVLAAQMRHIMTAAYDTIYRRYFSANEQASADRTRALRFIVAALILLSVAFLFLPLQGVMKNNLVRQFFSRIKGHRRITELKPGARRQIYSELIDVVGEEEKMRETMGLAATPRLSVVDEMRVAIVRPADRLMARQDQQFAAVESARENGVG